MTPLSVKLKALERNVQGLEKLLKIVLLTEKAERNKDARLVPDLKRLLRHENLRVQHFARMALKHLTGLSYYVRYGSAKTIDVLDQQAMLIECAVDPLAAIQCLKVIQSYGEAALYLHSELLEWHSKGFAEIRGKVEEIIEDLEIDFLGTRTGELEQHSKLVLSFLEKSFDGESEYDEALEDREVFDIRDEYFYGHLPVNLESAPVDELEQKLNSNNWQLVVYALSRFGDSGTNKPGVIERMAKHLKHPNAAVRRWAAYSLGKLGAKAEAALPSLELAQWDEDRRVKRTAEFAIKSIKGEWTSS